MISATDYPIIPQVDDLNNQGIIDHWNSHKSCVVDVFGRRNQYLQYSLDPLCCDINEIKKATII